MKKHEILELNIQDCLRSLPSVMELQKQANQNRSAKKLQKRIEQARLRMKSK